MVGVLETRVTPMASDDLEHLLRGELDCDPAEPADPAVVIERELAGGEVIGDAAEDPDDHRLGKEREQPVGDQHGRAVRRNGVRPVLVGQRNHDRMRLRVRRQHLVAQREDPRQVDAVPVRRWRRIDAMETAIETGTEVDDHSVGVPGDEITHPVVEHLRAQRCLAHHAGLHTEAGEVVIEDAYHFVGKCVTQDRSGPTAVQRPGVLGQKCGLLDRRQFGGGNPHNRESTPFFGLNGKPKTFTALAITRLVGRFFRAARLRRYGLLPTRPRTVVPGARWGGDSSRG